MKSLVKKLKKYGLDEKEARLYVAALQFPDGNMALLAKKADLKRPTAYHIYKTLEAKGFMGGYKTKSGMRFRARDPEILLQKAEEQIKELTSTLPELQAITKKKHGQPKVTYYEGVEAYKQAVEDVFKYPGEELLLIGSVTEAHKVISEQYDLECFRPKRIENGNFLKTIYTADTPGSVKSLKSEGELREIRYLPKDVSMPTLTLIYKNKMIVATSKQESAVVVIESEEIAQAEREKFNLIWESLS